MQYSCLTALLLCACVTIDVSEAKRHNKNVIERDVDAANKKFNIVARPQVSPDAMTVVLKGRDGPLGKRGSTGDPGERGPPGQKGPPGDKGSKGVCSRTQCENEKLKYLIQRLLALEKYVNNKLLNEENKGEKGESCSKNPDNGNPTLPPCTVTATVIAILPGQADTKGKGQDHVPSQGPSKNHGGPSKTRPKPEASSPSRIWTPKIKRPRPTPAIDGAPTTKRPATPTASPFITIPGFTSYDSASHMPPISASEPMTVVGGPMNQFSDVPGNWVTSGSGPIDLKPALYRRTALSRVNEQNYYSSSSSLKKRHNIPSPGHGLLTHKLAGQMLNKSSNKKEIKNTHHKPEGKHHKKVTSKKTKHAAA